MHGPLKYKTNKTNKESEQKIQKAILFRSTQNFVTRSIKCSAKFPPIEDVLMSLSFSFSNPDPVTMTILKTDSEHNEKI